MKAVKAVKAVIKKRTNLIENEGVFLVYYNDAVIRCFTFKLNIDDELWSEEVNRQKAIELAQKLNDHNGEFEIVEEIKF